MVTGVTERCSAVTWECYLGIVLCAVSIEMLPKVVTNLWRWRKDHGSSGDEIRTACTYEGRWENEFTLRENMVPKKSTLIGILLGEFIQAVSQLLEAMLLLEFFNSHDPSCRTMALWSTHPLTEMSTRNISWGLGGIELAGALGWQSHQLHVPIVMKSRSLNLLYPSGPVQGLLYLIYLFLSLLFSRVEKIT